MTEFGKPQPCRNKCGAWIYFDSDSKPSHPSPDKWIPLEYSVDTGLRTGQVHRCPNWLDIPRSNDVDQYDSHTDAAVNPFGRLSNFLEYF
jgi:hypothetical protein